MKEARFYTMTEAGVQCLLCPHHCRIQEGGRGICRSRECHDGKLWALSYGIPCALAIDPVEKKPLNRFLPGTYCLSLSCTGCNLSCRWCQNSDISQVAPEEAERTHLSPADAVDLCLRRGLPALAYTYTEPFTWWEYMYDIAVLAHGKGLKNILVSAGYVEQEPLRELLPYLDAANIDIKALDDDFYRKYCGATLAPVLENILAMKAAGVHVEITSLLVTSLNDSVDFVARLCQWMAENGLQNVPLHFSRYFPRYRMKEPGPTPAATLFAARETALSMGIRDVFLGNI
ncbi:MAG: AmmeMemoRadiSam system radical SAM enzyme [Bacteroidales bacterium]|nr:AmmeMemoRadiSam system radical SAM enzyme [Bacteroidales bacterium]MBQ2194925.1 AmmeMemoRadiSam system radical SAM enzyme [Bacteroidales bacterium]MBQ4221639.1 AmmeMemoRadiSam system radical SAM enzyme [Bacteroidales bacterium]MBQ5529282.1 AmmeMemoRadiSam system radical SAM enzyme [Bacteroidales bacterium]